MITIEEQRKQATAALRLLADRVAAEQVPILAITMMQYCEDCEKLHPQTITFLDMASIPTDAHVLALGAIDVLKMHLADDYRNTHSTESVVPGPRRAS